MTALELVKHNLGRLKQKSDKVKAYPVSYTHLVGSAIIKIIDEYGEASPKHVGEYVKAMKDAL